MSPHLLFRKVLLKFCHVLVVFAENWYLKQTILNKFIHINVKTQFSNASFHYYTEYNYLQFDGMTLDLP